MASNKISPLTKFLLPIDGSETSQRAVGFAGCLAAGLGDQIVGISLLHVLAGSYLRTHMANVDVRTVHVLESQQFQRLKDKYIAGAVDPLIAKAEEELRRVGSAAPVYRLVVDGDPAEQIVKVGDQGDYSTIIMGRSGRSRISELLLGSVTSAVLHQPHNRSVYVVGQRILEDGVCLLPKILIPVDGSSCSFAAVREAAVLARCYGEGVQKITLLHVVNLARYAERLEKGTQPEKESREILHNAESHFLDAGIAREKLETVANYGNPVEVILKAAADREVTLIMMSRCGRSALRDFLLGSVSKEILYRCIDPTVAIVCGG